MSRHSSDFSTLFRHRFGLAHHLVAWRRYNRRPFCSSRRFSARFGHLCRGANLHQNLRHHPTDLPRGHHIPSPFPGMVKCLSKVAGEHQLIHGSSHHQTPALKLLWGSHAHLGPEQILLQEAIGMLMRKALLIGPDHLRERKRLLAQPDEPTLTGSVAKIFKPIKIRHRMPIKIRHRIAATEAF